MGAGRLCVPSVVRAMRPVPAPRAVTRPARRAGDVEGRRRDAGRPSILAWCQAGIPSSRAISIRWTSLVPSPISRILESRHIRATGYSFMKP